MSDIVEPGGQTEDPLNQPLPRPPPQDIRPPSSTSEASASEMDAIDREVSEAMGSMEPQDLADLCGEVATGEA